MSFNRRQFLAMSTSLATSACVDIRTGDPDIEINESETKITTSSIPETIGGLEIEPNIDDSVVLDEGQYSSWTFELDEITQLELDVTVREGLAIDVMTMYLPEFREMVGGHRFRYLTELSMMNTLGANKVGTLTPGEEFDETIFKLVADHTTAGVAEPPLSRISTAEVDLELSEL